MIILIIVLLFFMCFSIFNYWFQSEKYKSVTDEEIKKLNWFNSPAAWLCWFIVSFLALLILVSYFIYNFYIAALKLG